MRKLILKHTERYVNIKLGGICDGTLKSCKVIHWSIFWEIDPNVFMVFQEVNSYKLIFKQHPSKIYSDPIKKRLQGYKNVPTFSTSWHHFWQKLFFHAFNSYIVGVHFSTPFTGNNPILTPILPRNPWIPSPIGQAEIYRANGRKYYFYELYKV